ncbi:dipeptidase [Filibacter tadaridae]|uniref:Membrane dipeptidase (Peptidase family M19) n=1 Tax=Filibacter tadaridae TaxID=2483811 RepID=A0A3P5WMR9_9BACL|nr:dipeptidase [Filibacter tadaridae]VDC24803.1 Membrane dipeptidase (Peptidase family M19) [Filibacter tadaridae]
MNVIDLHCDVLLKLYESKGKLKFQDAPELDTNFERLKKGGVKVQAFAIFIYPEVKSDDKFQVALDQIHYFYTEVLGKNSSMKLIKDWDDLSLLKEGETGALLTLEGVDAIGNDLQKLTILYELGVRSIGLTWNNANLAADGAGEKRGAGLTSFGTEIVEWNNRHKIFTDVSHLCEKAFWDVMDVAKYPIASHSNARSICDHVRNLRDDQAKAMFAQGGMIHIVYAPQFVKVAEKVTISNLIEHIDHFCSLGGVHQIGLGSDFDGISKKIVNLEDASMHTNLVNELLKYYSEDTVQGFASQNFLNHLPK